MTPDTSLSPRSDFDPASGSDKAASHEAEQQKQNSPREAGKRNTQGFIEYKGERIALDQNYWDPQANDGQGGANIGALAKAVTDLRRQVSDTSSPPETYDLTVPEALKDKIAIDPDHPLARPAMEWAKKHGLSQESFDELTALFYQEEARHSDWEKEHQATLHRVLGDDVESVKTDLGRWIMGLLGDELNSTPELMNGLHEMATTAEGVLFMNALKNKVGETSIPSSRDDTGGLLSAADVRTLQASQAYLDSTHPDHKATVDKVRAGWKRLYPE